MSVNTIVARTRSGADVVLLPVTKSFDLAEHPFGVGAGPRQVVSAGELDHRRAVDVVGEIAAVVRRQKAIIPCVEHQGRALDDGQERPHVRGSDQPRCPLKAPGTRRKPLIPQCPCHEGSVVDPAGGGQCDASALLAVGLSQLLCVAATRGPVHADREVVGPHEARRPVDDDKPAHSAWMRGDQRKRNKTRLVGGNDRHVVRVDRIHHREGIVDVGLKGRGIPERIRKPRAAYDQT